MSELDGTQGAAVVDSAPPRKPDGPDHEGVEGLEAPLQSEQSESGRSHCQSALRNSSIRTAHSLRRTGASWFAIAQTAASMIAA